MNKRFKGNNWFNFIGNFYKYNSLWKYDFLNWILCPICWSNCLWMVDSISGEKSNIIFACDTAKVYMVRWSSNASNGLLNQDAFIGDFLDTEIGRPLSVYILGFHLSSDIWMLGFQFKLHFHITLVVIFWNSIWHYPKNLKKQWIITC